MPKNKLPDEFIQELMELESEPTTLAYDDGKIRDSCLYINDLKDIILNFKRSSLRSPTIIEDIDYCFEMIRQINLALRIELIKTKKKLKEK